MFRSILEFPLFNRKLCFSSNKYNYELFMITIIIILHIVSINEKLKVESHNKVKFSTFIQSKTMYAK